MKTYKLLGIAPYDGIRLLMREAASQREDIVLDAYTGNLEDGCALAQQYAGDYDCIISRGDTAQQIRQVTTKPIVEIEFSAYDLLQSINLARSCADKWAIVGFAPITKNAKIISDLLQYNLDIFTLQTKEDADWIISEIKSQGYQMIVCDTITDIYAKRQGVDSILIHSGLESIERAIDEAVHICESYAQIKEQKDLYEMLLNNLEIDSFVFDSEKNCVYANPNQLGDEEIKSIVLNQLTLPEWERSEAIQKNIRGTIYNIEAKQVAFRGEMYSLYNVYYQKNKTTKKASGIQYYTANELNESLLAGFYLSPTLELSKYEQLGKSGSFPPLMLLGGPGTGKSECAAYLHIKGQNWNNPYIDCSFAKMNEKELQYLLTSINSPFRSNQVTFHFREIDTLDEEKFCGFLSAISDSHLCSCNRIIFSWTHDTREKLPERARAIMDRFTCYTITLPTVQERIDEIPQMVTKYINSFNSMMSKQSAGLQSDAVTLMKAYDWPGNLSQLKRVIFQAVSQSDGMYISADTIRSILDTEKGHLIPEAKLSLDLSGTLDEIKQEVAKIVLAQCGNNQSKAAERLGIGRTTLWRMLGR